MKNGKKIRVMVLYGGRSGEHEVSLRSAASVLHHLDKERFEVVPVAIDKTGRWLLNDVSLIAKSAQSLPVYKDAPTVVMPPHPGSMESGLIRLGPGAPGSSSGADVVFPVMHGPLCEDGAIQGLFELADVAYVGSGVLASAVGMDKDITKRLIRDAGILSVPYIALKKESWQKTPEKWVKEIQKQLGLPLFVKPANMGSSVGVHKVKDLKDLDSAIQDAFRYDTKIMIEKAVRAREIEVAVLENIDDESSPLASTPGEIIPTHEFYSYESKYIDENGAHLLIPAKLNPEQTEKVRKIAQDAFTTLGCQGMARVDFFLDQDSGDLYFNEINTLPGFTSISMYPKMWEYSGLPYSQLLSKLIDLALARHEKQKQLVREFHNS